MSGVAVLIPAAGRGERLGRGPKAFLRLGDRTLIEHAVAAFTPFADQVAVALPAERTEEGRRLVPQARVIAGGASRQATVAALLAATTCPWVLVHDAARPLVPTEVAVRVLDAARRHGAASAALAVADTLHDVRRDVPVARDAYRAIQTPQGFARPLLVRAHERARNRAVPAADDAQLVRELGEPVALVTGSPWSHKATVEGDLRFLEALLYAGSAAPGAAP